jgi:DNA-binding beta-propeller fold protein YncE
MPDPVDGFAINNHLLLAEGSVGSGGGTVVTFRADKDGNLTRLLSTPLASDVNARGIGLDASGSFAYVGGGSGIYGYAVNRDTGALTPLPGSPFSAPSFQGWIDFAVAPNGSKVCAEAPPHKTIAGVVCFVRHSDGTLDTSAQGQNTPTSNTGDNAELAITPDSAFLVWTDNQKGTVNASPLGNNTGVTTGTAPAGGQLPTGVAINGQWVAVVTAQPNNISIFTINSSGQLAAAGSPVALSGSPGGVAFSADGSYLFVSTDSGLLTYSFNKGALQAVGNATPGGSRAVVAE